MRIPFAPMLAVALAATAAAQDKVTLDNGDVLTGKVKTMADGKLTVNSAALGDVVVPMANVKNLQTGEEVQLRTTTGDLIRRRIAGIDSGTMRFEGQGTELVSNLDSINPPEKKDAEWTGALKLGAGLISGNTERRSVSGAFDAEPGGEWPGTLGSRRQGGRAARARAGHGSLGAWARLGCGRMGRDSDMPRWGSGKAPRRQTLGWERPAAMARAGWGPWGGWCGRGGAGLGRHDSEKLGPQAPGPGGTWLGYGGPGTSHVTRVECSGRSGPARDRDRDRRDVSRSLGLRFGGDAADAGQMMLRVCVGVGACACVRMLVCIHAFGFV